ncbi:hypothetical protein AAFF_G00086640 [Aldrovandia affinis]|uniref:Uncharacterized protein n=1 Tax=Aldrovandia affinis TaxID=143900 RepID=A0AAD7RWS5_9TELE|nr:hypothetical protein AAFF_G00086640 [Aldrovandia affinis]
MLLTPKEEWDIYGRPIAVSSFFCANFNTSSWGAEQRDKGGSFWRTGPLPRDSTQLSGTHTFQGHPDELGRGPDSRILRKSHRDVPFTTLE